MRKFLLIVVVVLAYNAGFSQNADVLVSRIREKLASVKEYDAIGKLKTDVAFLKLPLSNVKIHFKYPDQFSIKKEGGISVLPKGGLKISMNSLLADGNFVSFTAGNINWKGKDLLIVKLVPSIETTDIVITTLYVEEKSLLIRKAITTTKDNGTYEMEMEYGKYAQWALPDKAVMSFSIKDYKLPKAITFEYEAGVGPKKEPKKPLGNKGQVEIIYSSYTISKKD